MLEKFQRLPLRNGVGIVLLNKSNQVFVARRIDNPSRNWQMPQGGVDNNESYYDAAIRELKEETSIRNIALLKEIDEFIDPDHLELKKPRRNSSVYCEKNRKS